MDTEFDISIGQTGVLNGLIKAENIVVSGLLEGKVTCKSIDILSTGKVIGEVICSELMIESGGRFIGESRELTDGAMLMSFTQQEQLSHFHKHKMVDAEVGLLSDDLDKMAKKS